MTPIAALTEAEYFVLRWLDEHSSFKHPKLTEDWIRLGVPRKHRNAFNYRTLRNLENQNLIASDGHRGIKVTWKLTERGRQVYLEAQLKRGESILRRAMRWSDVGGEP